MLIIPAIDILDGRCVRLYQGDYGRRTVYPVEPQDVAIVFQNEGADMIHMVDLDAAREGRPVNTDIMKKVIDAVSIPVEIGGGARTIDHIEFYLDMGARRVVIGSRALDTEFVKAAMRLFGPSKVAAGVDVRKGHVMVDGWSRDGGLPVELVIRRLAECGLTTIIYTDITKDGAMTSPDFDAYRRLVTAFPTLDIVASGGISSVEDVVRLASTGVAGVIIGRALYEGRIKLTDLKEKRNAG